MHAPITPRRTMVSYIQLAVSLLALGACAADADTEPLEESSIAEGGEALSCASPAIDNMRSLFVTDETALNGFRLSRVMNKLIDTAGTGAQQTSLLLYQQWWDLNNNTAGALTSGPHCDAITTPPFLCPRQEGALARTNPFTNEGTNTSTNPDSYIPLALVNRFDLAPADGSNCGEYRIVYGKVSGKTDRGNRNLIAFEAVLPNPAPSRGLAACRPVAEFWADLSAVADASARASRLGSFYFNGLTGFSPVVHFSNFRGRDVSASSGQIRTNQFMRSRGGQEWTLRETKLARVCPTATTCKLVMNQATVKDNPRGDLFAELAPRGGLTSFQRDFVNNRMPTLIGGSIHDITLNMAPGYDGFESREQSPDNNYALRVPLASPFRVAIRNQAASLGSSLSVDNILHRATSQSCAGCHNLSSGRDLGGGLTWPRSNLFTHIDENRNLSPALTAPGGFLAQRQANLLGFLCPPSPRRPSAAGAPE